MKFFRDITAIITFILAVFMLIGCTPGKAQTKTDSDYQRNNEQRGKYTAAADEDSEEYFSGESGYEDKELGYKDGKGRNSSDSSKSRRYDSGNDNANYDLDTTGVSVDNGFYQKGAASWYGREFHGKMTASGEKFNMYEMTAAHKTLPFGSIVLVKNLDNGKEVTVRINDRGPYKDKRIIDLSYNAAKKIDILSNGMGYVGIKVLKRGTSEDDSDRVESNDNDRNVEPVVDEPSGYNSKEDGSSGKYSLQAGAFYSRKNAENLQKKIEGLTEHPVIIIQDEDLYKVRIERISGRREAEKQKRILSDEDISTFIVESQE